MKWKYEDTNMMAAFDPWPRVGIDSFYLNICPTFNSKNCEPCDLSDYFSHGILRLKAKVDERRYKHYMKRMKENWV